MDLELDRLNGTGLLNTANFTRNMRHRRDP